MSLPLRHALALIAVVGVAGCSSRPPGPAMPGTSPPDAALAAPSSAAVGPTGDLPAPLARAFDPAGFEPLGIPGPNDWRAAHPEPEQTFAEFVASGPNIPDARRRVIHLLPLGELPTDGMDLDRFRRYAEIYFGLEARLLPPLPLADLKVTSRPGRGFGRRQLLAPDILHVLDDRVPADSYCLTALTMADLYPDPTWNFVFGMAAYKDRVGVHSFARLGDLRTPAGRAAALRRGLKVMAHEIGHMFGLAHCLHFACAMNGSNHLDESDSRPMHLCPVCLRKLHHVVRFDPAERYRRLAAFYRDIGYSAEADWTERRARRVADGR